MRLSNFILSEMPSILAEWDEFALTLEPAASDMTVQELRNHAEHMLKGIAKDITSKQSPEEQVIKSHGGEARDAHIVTGEEHGVARLDSRFTTEQLASEFRALRASVLKLWGQKVTLTSLDIDDIIRFNESIDQLLAASISSFTQATTKLLEGELKRKEQFLAMLAHELRNPLAPISASATMLKRVPHDARIVEKAGDVIARQVAHMTGLVDDLLEVSRVTNGSVPIRMQSFDFRQVIDGALEQVQPKIALKNHHLTTPLLSNPISMLGDKKRLVQVLVNLLVNAAKYTPDGGRIWLKIDAQADYVEVIVEDDGIGIAPEFAPHVFELFSQANPSMDRTSGGLGLGLPLVKSLVEQHSGKVSCTSKGIGKGSSFSVILPTCSEEVSDREQDNSFAIPPVTEMQVKIMVVDDNIDAAETLCLLLETLGYEVIMAHDSAEVLSKARLELPDAFLLDIGLPTMDGNELARRIRSVPEIANAALIAVTGYSQAHNRDESMQAGFNHFMTKPVEMAALQSVLDSVKQTRKRVH